MEKWYLFWKITFQGLIFSKKMKFWSRILTFFIVQESIFEHAFLDSKLCKILELYFLHRLYRMLPNNLAYFFVNIQFAIYKRDFFFLI